MNESTNAKEKYEILTQILNKNLKEQLNIESPKEFSSKKTYAFKFNNLNYELEIKSIEIEVDDIGVIREKIFLPKGEINLKSGITY